MRLAGLLMFGWLAVPVGASARMLEVGPQRALKTPSAAARMAEPGDQVVIDPGEYFDCAFWRTNGITIAAAPGDPVVFTDRSCGGKASFVISGNDVTVLGATANDLITLTALNDPGSSVDGTFNRIDIKALSGSAAFDIG